MAMFGRGGAMPPGQQGIAPVRGMPAPTRKPPLTLGASTGTVRPQARVPLPRPMLRGPEIAGTFKKGGKVRKTGNYKLHKGEVVVPVSRLLRAR